LKAAIYCRVSTEGQEQEGTSLHTQLEAWSGLSLERPKLAELRELTLTQLYLRY